jgi:hypothetical protein
VKSTPSHSHNAYTPTPTTTTTYSHTHTRTLIHTALPATGLSGTHCTFIHTRTACMSTLALPTTHYTTSACSLVGSTLVNIANADINKLAVQLSAPVGTITWMGASCKMPSNSVLPVWQWENKANVDRGYTNFDHTGGPTGNIQCKIGQCLAVSTALMGSVWIITDCKVSTRVSGWAPSAAISLDPYIHCIHKH